jgi:acetoin utilization deacetylase AcuC-like enzyme
MATVFLTHPDCVLHEMGAGHPESPQRLRSILSAIESSGLAASLDLREAPEATREQLERVHEREHVELIHQSAPQAGYAYLDPDTSSTTSRSARRTRSPPTGWSASRSSTSTCITATAPRMPSTTIRA